MIGFSGFVIPIIAFLFIPDSFPLSSPFGGNLIAIIKGIWLIIWYFWGKSFSKDSFIKKHLKRRKQAKTPPPYQPKKF